ncbi:MAG TPA: glycine zipper 2TM domain-containing protein [Xanthomonadaceae bacterium]|jgi:uncharacterized protein YcfJ
MNKIRTMTAAGLLLCMGCGAMGTAMAECHEQVVYHRVHDSNHHHVVGTVVGAVVGGVIGHQFGGGTGKVLTTAGGAVAGGAIGHKIAKDNSGYRTYRTTERVCTPDNPPNPPAG